MKPVNQYPGFFLVLEGPDGVGKSTQTIRTKNYLMERIRQHFDAFDAPPADRPGAVSTAEPTSGDYGREIRRLLGSSSSERLSAGQLALLFALDRLQHCEKEIGPALARGCCVVCDRYLPSSLVYQSMGSLALSPRCDRDALPEKTVEDMNARAIPPDVYLLLDDAHANIIERFQHRGGPLDATEGGPHQVLAQVLAYRHLKARHSVFAAHRPLWKTVATAAGNEQTTQDRIREAIEPQVAAWLASLTR